MSSAFGMRVLISGLACSALLVHPCVGSANTQNLRRGTERSELLSEESVRRSLLTEIEAALGSGGAIESRRLGGLEESLGPMYATLPKNSYGNLDHNVVRYALHRHFVQKHGWHFNGLEANTHSNTSSSPAGMLKDRVPAYIQELVEKRMGSHGLALHELAVLAATLEHLVHDEALQRLSGAYEALRLPTWGTLDQGQVQTVLEAYMLAFIRGTELVGMTPNVLRAETRVLAQEYPGWKDTVLFIEDVLQGVAHAQRHQINPFKEREFGFDDVARVMEEMGDRFGRFQDLECRTMKDALLEIEDSGTGRVRLSRFYKTALDGQFLFQESADYLREIGALDESDARTPRVVVANYIGSSSNCLAASNFFSVCCIDECEGLLAHVEAAVAAPAAPAARLAALVSRLSSSTVDAPRNLSASMMSRLEGIADLHGGSVPLHGRLFAQWMHHAFPSECPYPAIIAAASSTASTWSRTAEERRQPEEDMEKHSWHSGDASFQTAAQALPWSEEEVLIASPKALGGANGSPRSFLQKLAMLGALLSMSAVAVSGAKSALSATDNAKYKEFSKLI